MVIFPKRQPKRQAASLKFAACRPVCSCPKVFASNIFLSISRFNLGETLVMHETHWFVTVRNEIVKVMFLHLSVILFTGGGLCQCMLGYQPPLGAGTPSLGAGTPSLGAGTPSLGAGTPWSRHPPGAGTPPRAGTPLGAGTPKQAPPGPGTPVGAEMATAADGTHPTGMHSCYILLPSACTER